MDNKEIKPSKILEFAIDLVSSAKSCIEVTMRSAEESQNPLPPEYFSLLKKKTEEDIKVIRVGFGAEKEFKKLSHIHINNPHYFFYRTDSSDYKRMLLIDRSKMIFAKNDSGRRRVYFSDDPKVIDEYTQYLTRFTDKTIVSL